MFIRALVLGLLLTAPAYAADVLFVADSNSDTTIATALTGDGHRVTSVLMDYSMGRNTRLAAPLAEFDIVVWSADGPGDGGVHSDSAVIANLLTYVMNGGHLIVVGYDAIAGPTDPLLIGLLGGTDARSSTDSGRITMTANSLTNGVIDLRGMTPPSQGDTDCLRGIGRDTVSVVTAAGDSSCHQWTLRSLGLGEVAFIGSGPDTVWDTASPYNGAVRNFAAAVDNGTTESGAPSIELHAPYAVREGEAIEATATIADAEGNAITFAWDTNGDGRYEELEGENEIELPAVDGPATIKIGVSATDSAGHVATRVRTLRVSNVDPAISSNPGRVARVGMEYTYAVVASDPIDTPMVELDLAPPNAILDGTTVRWTPTEAVSAAVFRVLVTDGDEAEVAQAWTVTVAENNGPSKPEAVYPVGDIGLLEQRPRLVVTNAVDIDFDDLVYSFEIDSADTFDSPDFQTSGDVAEGVAVSEWTVTDALEPGHYYWRAFASDGAIKSEPATGSFYVLAPPTDVDAGPSTPDASVADAGRVTPMASGCGCRTVPSSSAPMWLALGAALLWVRRRRVFRA